jgi:hypothetical protein
LSQIDDDWLGSLIREAFNLIVEKDSAAGSRKSSKRRRR